MTASTVFVASFGSVALGLVCALVAEVLGRARVAAWVAAAGLLAGGAIGLWAGWAVPAGEASGGFAAGVGFSSLPGLVFVLAASVVAARAWSPAGEVGGFAPLAALGALGAGLAVAASDLITLMLALETSALCGYALVSIARTPRAAEASLKYLVQGAVATAFFVVGLALSLSFAAPSARYAEIYTTLAGAPGATGPITAGALLLIAALAFKVGAAPMHSWAPDAYETAPHESAALLSGGVKLASTVALVVVTVSFATAAMNAEHPLGLLGGDLLPSVAVLGALSILLGSLLALRQRSYARMLAYAGVAQVGYSLIAVASLSATAAVVQAAAYAIVTTGAYLAIGSFRAARPTWDGSIAGLAGLGRRSPAIGAAMVMLMASLAGIPPLLGFWGKFESLASVVYAAGAFSAAGSKSGALYAGVAVVGVLGAVVSLAYYGAVLRSLYFDQAPEADATAQRPVAAVAYAVLALGLGLVPFVVGLGVAVSGIALR